MTSLLWVLSCWLWILDYFIKFDPRGRGSHVPMVILFYGAEPTWIILYPAKYSKSNDNSDDIYVGSAVVFLELHYVIYHAKRYSLRSGGHATVCNVITL